MKSLFYLTVFISVLNWSFVNAQTKLESAKNQILSIDGILDNIQDSIPYVYILYLDNTKNDYDSAKVENHRYHIDIKTKTTTLVTLFPKAPNDPNHYKNIFVFLSEPTKVLVHSQGKFSNASVSRSKADKEFRLLENIRKPYSEEITKLYMQKQSKTTDSTNIIERKADSLRNKIDEKYLQYIQFKRLHLGIPYALNYYVEDLKTDEPPVKIEMVKKLYNQFSIVEKNSFYGKSIKRKLDSYTITLGMQAPDFVQNDTSNHPVSLSDFKGKYLLLDIWASWCGPCRKENPNLITVYNKFKDHGFTILSVSLDKKEDRTKWLEAIRKDRLCWTQVSDLEYWNNKVAKLYHIAYIPQNFLIDPTGKIIGIGLRGDNLMKKLQEIWPGASKP